MTENVKTQGENLPEVLDDDQQEALFNEMVAKREADKNGETSQKEPESKAAEKKAAPKAADESTQKEVEKSPQLSDEELLALVPEDRRDAVRSRLEAEYETQRKLDNNLRSVSGRVSAYQRRYEEAIGRRPAEAAKAASVESLNDWKEIEKDYPDLAKGIRQLFESKGGNPEDIRGLVDYVESEKRARFLSDAYDAVEAVHPGWREVIKQQEFRGWLKTSPAYERLASSEDIADAILLFDQWNFHAGQTQQEGNSEEAAEADRLAARREAQTRGAQTPRSRAASPNQEVDLNDEEQLFQFYASKANERMRTRHR